MREIREKKKQLVVGYVSLRLWGGSFKLWR
jgi:hypothetical protein